MKFVHAKFRGWPMAGLMIGRHMLVLGPPWSWLEPDGTRNTELVPRVIIMTQPPT